MINMRLTKLHIYGFGRFQDYQIKLSEQPIHVFLGENESGKSTIMAFIRCILFGFPTKQQSELRYEPRLGGRYGGSITLETLQYKEVKVERVGGKATGDVEVYFLDGTIGGEAELKLILGSLDRTIFSGIYSFGILDLQTVEQLKSEELNRFMYGVGISGRHSILEFEKKTEKSLQMLYKPAGRKPIINKQLSKVADSEEKVINWKKKLGEHETLISEKSFLTETLQQVNGEKIALNQTYRHYEKLKTIAPIVFEKISYQSQLQQLTEFEPFPEDGILRFEKIQNNCVSVEADLTDIEEKLQKIDADKVKLSFHEQLPELEEKVAEVREMGKIYQSKQEEKGLLGQQIQFALQELSVVKEKLGNKAYEEIDYDTSFLAEQVLEKLNEEEIFLKQQEQLLQTQFQQAKVSFEQKELQVEQIRQQLLTEEVRHQLEQEKAKDRTKLEMQQELNYLDQSLQHLDIQQKVFSVSKSMPILILSGLLSLLGVVVIYFGATWYLGALLSVAGLTVFVLTKLEAKFRNKKVIKDLEKQREKLTSHRQVLLNNLNDNGGRGNRHQGELLKKDDQLREQLSLKELSLNEAEEVYDHFCRQLDKWEWTNSEFQRELINWAKQYSFPLNLEASNYLKLLKIVEELKKKARQTLYLTGKKVTIEAEITEIENKVNQLCQSFSISYDVTSHLQHVEKLSERLKKQQQSEKIYNRLFDQYQQLNGNLKTLQIRQNQFQKEINKLYQIANVENEEAFRQKGKAWQDSEQIKEQIRILTSRIMPLVESEKDLVQLESDVIKDKDVFAEKIAGLEGKISQCWEQEKKLHERLAAVNLAVEELEEGSSYSVSLHNFEKEKDILKKEVKKWAFHRTVQLLIDEAKAVYERDRQPKVIKAATKMFSDITKGEYRQLFAPIGEQRFIVERNDGMRFSPNELSQGTKEQLYLAIRLALATVHSVESSFPILIDDIFVNFDEKRRLQALTVLNEMSEHRQIIFFTCHPFMAKEISPSYFLLANNSE